MLNILITGANGQLGSELRLRGAQTEDNYIPTDVAELDITDASAVHRFVADNKIDVIVNCAAYTNVDKAEDDFAAANLVNNTAADNLASAAARSEATLIHISTDYVFEGISCLPYRESDPTTSPRSVYGRTKLAGERAVAASGCKYLIVRTGWLYSGFGNNFVKTMLRLTSERDTLDVVFDQVGTPTYAGDLADAIIEIIDTRLYKDTPGIYHFSDEGVCSWYDFAVEIARLAGNTGCHIRPCHSDEFPTKAQRPSFSVLDKTKIKNTFGIAIPHWRDSLAVCVETLLQK